MMQVRSKTHHSKVRLQHPHPKLGLHHDLHPDLDPHPQLLFLHHRHLGLAPNLAKLALDPHKEEESQLSEGRRKERKEGRKNTWVVVKW